VADDEDLLGQFPEIPEILHSLEFDSPFKRCTQCQAELGSEETFQLQKVMKRGEPIMEFALCEECHDELIDSFSEETKNRLEDYYEKNAISDFNIETCIFCGIPRRELEEYNVSGHCIADRLLVGSCICFDCLMKIQPLLSKQTRDSRDRFRERNFPGVPADARPMLV